MSKAELQIELRQLRKEHLQGGSAVSKMSLQQLRTEVAAIRHLQGRTHSHPSLDGKTVGRPAARPMHNATVEDADEDGEGIRTPAVPEKKVIIKDPRGGKRSDEQMAKMQEAAKKAREAKKAAKEAESFVKQPELPTRSERKSVHFCNCPSCPDRH